MNKTINQLDEIASAELTDEAVIFDLSENDTKKMTVQKAFNAMHKLSSTSVADSADELALYDSANNVTKKITKQNLLSEIQPPIIASSTTINGPAVEEGLYIKVIFTSAISASDTVTPLEITYNGDSVPVKVMKSGVASDIFAHEISSGVYSYLQAMTSFEMVYDDTNSYFVIIGNPIVLSSTDYTIYADGCFEQLKYSTSEVWTGKYWLDGKKIYQKTVENINPGTYVSISDYIEKVTNIFWSATSSNFTSSECYNWGSEGNSVVSDVWRITDGGVNHNKFYCRGVGGIFNSGKMTLTVEYTKTTD